MTTYLRAMGAEWQGSPDSELAPEVRGWSPVMRGAVEREHDRIREAMEEMR